jgi:hypothetical protein
LGVFAPCPERRFVVLFEDDGPGGRPRGRFAAGAFASSGASGAAAGAGRFSAAWRARASDAGTNPFTHRPHPRAA